MIIRLFSIYRTGKTIYTKVLKPIYEELKKDAYATENKIAANKKRKPRRKNVVNKKSKRSHQRQTNP